MILYHVDRMDRTDRTIMTRRFEVLMLKRKRVQRGIIGGCEKRDRTARERE